ncbi:DUF397 domain-containing protein [Streptomyces sp. NPDC051322]|uniref:DUF397 domain-containing protein n=1 Tax=Streptomyces sp. NPDC051322 TaxID=3154645 RepID=UPI003450144E
MRILVLGGTSFVGRVRDSKNPSGPALIFRADTWHASWSASGKTASPQDCQLGGTSARAVAHRLRTSASAASSVGGISVVSSRASCG